MTEYYKEKLEQGLKFQDFVVEQFYKIGIPIVTYASREFQLGGENMAGIEIKNDALFRTTGNFYIETAEKSDPANPAYIPSGVYRADNTWLYAIGDIKEVFIFSKSQLRLLAESEKYEMKETPTSRGFLLPVACARKYILKILP